MGVNSDHVIICEKKDQKIKSDEEIKYLEIEVKIEKLDEIENVKTEVFEETKNSERLQLSGEKRKNKEKYNLEFENKTIKKEFVVFEESDYKQEPQETEKNNLGDSNDQVIRINQPITLTLRKVSKKATKPLFGATFTVFSVYKDNLGKYGQKLRF